ncbi:MAG: SAM-dependent methyltransferase [Streptosporangiaceae bacterium]
MASSERTTDALDTSVAHIARVYDYLLGGKDNFEADRAAGDAMMRAYPDIADSMRSNRQFLARTVRYLAGDEGIRQFLDIGTGIPTANNTHEVAQSIAPDCRIVYVDRDPVVLIHARALLTSEPEGVTDYIEADIRDPQAILTHAASMLDFSQPIALMVVAILHFVPDEDHPHEIVATLLDALPSGSFLTLSHPGSDVHADAPEAARRFNDRAAEQATLRSRDDVMRFFDGLDMVEPGLVQVQDWRPTTPPLAASSTSLWAGVARKP